jgi:putative membrane protein
MRIVIRWLVTLAALIVALWIVPGIRVDGNAYLAVAVMAVVLALVNAFIRPVLRFLSCGAIILTLGLFLLVVNALTLWLASWIVQNWFELGFVVDGFWPAFWGGIIISVVSFLINLLLPEEDERRHSRGGRDPAQIVKR